LDNFSLKNAQDSYKFAFEAKRTKKAGKYKVRRDDIHAQYLETNEWVMQ
jgi:hypothetical protein